jgi:signal transduction histidine kinase/ActR/RegA family two-component response regulator
MALSCGLYFAIVARGILAAILLGYLHFAISSIASVLLGWIHLTRELEGRAPVKTNPRLAVGLFAAVFLSEAAVMGSLLTYQGGLPALYFLASLVQFGSALAVYLHHRHQLVIHAANVGQLLDERTAELRVAQEELARQNEILAQRLSEQARDLKAKTEVIDRQRRLELAAQTAGQVAHDIQNLLSPILTRAEDLDQARSLGEIREISTVIRRQVQALLDLNTQLLALSRRGRVEQQPVYLSELVRDVVERFPGQQITIDLQGEAWASGSWSQLSRAISNLVTNALESNLDRLVPVTVRVRTAEVAQNRRCHLGFLGPGRYAVIEIEDRGPGIPEGHLDKIFEPFFSSKTGKHRSGSGLGLTIVAAVVDDHKGVLDLETGAQGTRFTLYFPATQPPADAPELVKLSCNATVLVVDDDSSIQREYGKLLQEAGYTVIPAESGAQAIRVLQAQEVDLVLLDLQMPRMNGLETFLGAMHVRPGVRAVVHSSYITEQQGAQLKALGVCSLLLKPAGRLDLLRALRHAYDEKKASEGRRKGHLP